MALVYDPKTGTLVPDGTGVPGNPARAKAMAAQYAQPVTGPNGVVGAPPAPAYQPFIEDPVRAQIREYRAQQERQGLPVTGQGLNIMGPAREAQARRAAQQANDVLLPELQDRWVAPQPQPAVSNVNPNAINVGGAAVDMVTGAANVIPAAAVDLPQILGVQLAGGDTRTIDGNGAWWRTRAALDKASTGAGQLATATGQAARGIQSGALGVLGAAPVAAPEVPRVANAQPPAATPATTPAATPATTPAATPATTPAATPATTPATVGGGGTFSPAELASMNAQIADSLSRAREDKGILQPAQRGNYNQYNTDQQALRERALPTAGLNMGFGNGVSATDYLRNMEARDQARAGARQQVQLMRAFTDAQSKLSGDSTPGEFMAARASMAAIQPLLAQGIAGQSQVNDRLLANQGANQVAGLTNDGALLRGLLQSETNMEVANITGQYGLQGSLATAAAAIAAAEAKGNTPKDQLDMQRLALLQVALNQGDLETAQALSVGRVPAKTDVALDALGQPIGRKLPNGTIQLYDGTVIDDIRAASRRASGIKE